VNDMGTESRQAAQKIFGSRCWSAIQLDLIAVKRRLDPSPDSLDLAARVCCTFR